MFGPPVVEKLTLDGNRLLIWIYLEGRFDYVQSESVEMVLDKDGVVTDFRSTASDPTLRR